MKVHYLLILLLIIISSCKITFTTPPIIFPSLDDSKDSSLYNFKAYKVSQGIQYNLIINDTSYNNKAKNHFEIFKSSIISTSSTTSKKN